MDLQFRLQSNANILTKANSRTFRPFVGGVQLTQFIPEWLNNNFGVVN